MGKRGNSSNDDRRKKYKVASGIVDPNTCGVYATCPRNREKKCADELVDLFNDYVEEWDIKPSAKEEYEKDLTVEESVKAELKQMEDAKHNKDRLVRSVHLGQQCLVFIKLKKPIDPEKFVHNVLEDLFVTKEKKTRYTLKLLPVQSSCSASIEEIQKLARKILEPHFHGENQQPLKFAININKRNFNTIEKDTLTKKIAECVGHNHGHKVDLKNFDVLIMVECFKNNVGMSVVKDFKKFCNYNVDQIFEKAHAPLAEAFPVIEESTQAVLESDKPKVVHESKEHQNEASQEAAEKVEKKVDTEPQAAESNPPDNSESEGIRLFQ